MSECDGKTAFGLSFEDAILGCRRLWQRREHTSSKEAADSPEELIVAIENLGFGIARIF